MHTKIYKKPNKIKTKKIQTENLHLILKTLLKTKTYKNPNFLLTNKT